MGMRLDTIQNQGMLLAKPIAEVLSKKYMLLGAAYKIYKGIDNRRTEAQQVDEVMVMREHPTYYQCITRAGYTTCIHKFSIYCGDVAVRETIWKKNKVQQLR